jgi:predicted transcriptional regulator of viral defense system
MSPRAVKSGSPTKLMKSGNSPMKQLERLVRYATKHGGISADDIQFVLHLEREGMAGLLKTLHDRGAIRHTPDGRWFMPPRKSDVLQPGGVVRQRRTSPSQEENP